MCTLFQASFLLPPSAPSPPNLLIPRVYSCHRQSSRKADCRNLFAVTRCYLSPGFRDSRHSARSKSPVKTSGRFGAGVCVCGAKPERGESPGPGGAPRAAAAPRPAAAPSPAWGPLPAPRTGTARCEGIFARSSAPGSGACSFAQRLPRRGFKAPRLIARSWFYYQISAPEKWISITR